MQINFKRLCKDAVLPTYAHEGDAGMDIYACLPEGEPMRVDRRSKKPAMIPTGFAIQLPEGYAALVLPRSGLAAKDGVTVANAPGLIDSGYRGEVRVLLTAKHGFDDGEDFVVNHHDRIAQLVIQRVEHVTFVEVDELDDTVRGKGGFGSSGVSAK